MCRSFCVHAVGIESGFVRCFQYLCRMCRWSGGCSSARWWCCIVCVFLALIDVCIHVRASSSPSFCFACLRDVFDVSRAMAVNAIGDAGAYSLSEALKVNSTVASIDLGGALVLRLVCLLYGVSSHLSSACVCVASFRDVGTVVGAASHFA